MPSYPLNDGPSLPRLAPFDQLRRSIDQVFTDFTGGVGFVPTPLDAAQYDFRPAAEVHDNGARTTIRIELPGVEVGDISLTVTGDMIEVAGQKKSETEWREGERYRSERSFGSFYRAFALPFPVDSNSVSADFEKGVLTISVPVPSPAATAARTIAIKSRTG